MQETKKKVKERQFVMAILHVVKGKRKENKYKELLWKQKESKRAKDVETRTETFTPEKKPIINLFLNTLKRTD